MGKPAVLQIKVLADARQAQAALDKTSGKVSKTSETMGKLALPAAAALGAIGAFGKTAVDAASAVEQSMGGLEAVFGNQAQAAKDLAKGAATATGLSTDAYATMAAKIGSQLAGMGTAQEDLVPSTDKLIKLGADLAATYGGTTADAVDAVSSLLRGERDPIERYGVSLNAATVAAQKAAMGLGGLTGAADTNATAQATMALLTQKTTAAQGQFAAQTNTTAEQQQIANAEYHNAQAALGQALLPAVTAVTKVLADMSGWVARNSKLVLTLTGIIAAAAVVILAYNAVVKAVAAAQKIWAVATKAMAAAQKLLNLALIANPIGLVIAAIALLVVGLVIAYKKVSWFRDAVNATFHAILAAVKAVASWIAHTLGPVFDQGFSAAAAAARRLGDAIKAALDVVMAIFRSVKSIIDTIAGAIRTVIDLISKIKIPNVGKVLGKLNPFSVAPPATGGAVSAANTRAMPAGRRARAGSSAGAGVTVNVYGALDPVSVARQLRGILASQATRNGTIAALSPGWAQTRAATP